MRRALAIAAAFVGLALAGPVASASALDVALIEDRILDPEAHARITYENTVNVASYQQDGVLTYNGWQYTAWYQNDGNGAGDASAVVARRELPDGEWESAQLAHPLWSNDSHNTIALGVTPTDGRLHVTFPTHDNPVRYTRTIPGVLDDPEAHEWSSLLFDRIHVLFPGAADGPRTFTYPQFENIGDTTLLTWRDGITNDGRQAVLRYNNDADGTWSFLGRFSHNAGGTYNGGFGNSASRYGYIHGFTADPASGDLAVTFSWREQNAAWCNSSTGVGNHDLGYTVSKDGGRTWLNNGGDTVARTTLGGTAGTITPFTQGIVVEEIGINKGLINQEAQAFDSQGRLHVMTSRVPDADIVGNCVADFYGERAAKAKPYHHWRDESGAWHTMELPFVSGSSGRTKIAFDAQDNAYVVLPSGKIAAATAASDWQDWEIVFDGFANAPVSELIIDRHRVREEGILTVAYQEHPSDVPTCRGGSASPNCKSAYRVASFALGSTDPDAEPATEPEAPAKEFEGFADDVANVALAGEGEFPRLVASGSQAGFPPAQANDGSVGTFWVSDQGPAPGNPVTLTAELDGPKDVGEVTIVPRLEYNRNTNPQNRDYGPRAFTVETSVDGDEWDEAADVDHAPAGEVTVKFPTRAAQYVRVRITDAHNTSQPPTNVQIAELIVRERDDSADSDAPRVEAELEGTQGPAGEYVNSAALALSATDEGSGVAAIEYREGGGAWQAYEGKVRFDEPGGYAVDFRARDNAGNSSTPETVEFEVAGNDTCDPIASDEFSGAELDTERWSFTHPTTPGAPQVEDGELVLPPGSFSLDNARGGPVTVLGQPLPEGEFTAIAKFTAPDLNTSDGGAGSAYAQVGFKLYQGDDNWIKVTQTRNADGASTATTYFELAYESNSVNRTLGPRTGLAAAHANLPTWWLKVERRGDLIDGYYSLTDPDGIEGAHWVYLGASPDIDAVMPAENGPRYLGLYSGNGDAEARVDYVRIVGEQYTGCEFPDPPPPPKPALKLAVKPKAKAVKPGRKAAFRATVRNRGDAPAKGVRVCVVKRKLPARVQGKPCVTVKRIAAGKAARARFVLKPKPAARGKRVRVTFRAKAQGVKAVTAAARLKVKKR